MSENLRIDAGLARGRCSDSRSLGRSGGKGHPDRTEADSDAQQGRNEPKRGDRAE